VATKMGLQVRFGAARVENVTEDEVLGMIVLA
jgi:hypothetical protein